ncbi:MAG: hypothetical protein RL885_23010 [Planctomycetota bacterium]
MKLAHLLCLALFLLPACVDGGGGLSVPLFEEDDGGGGPPGGSEAPPVASMTFETLGPDGLPSGDLLPVDPDTGEFILDRGQVFAVVIHAQPSVDTGVGFDATDSEGQGNPDVLQVTSDRPWPRPGEEPVPAGENLATLFRELDREDGDGDGESDPDGSITLTLIVGPTDQVPGVDPFRVTGQLEDLSEIETNQTEAAAFIAGSFPPSVRMSFETGPDSGSREFSGEGLTRRPSDDTPIVGSETPWVLVLEAIPNIDTGIGFDLIDEDNGDVGDPSTLVVTADVDFGDPAQGGIAAGENLAAFFHVDLDPVIDDLSGVWKIGLLIDPAGPIAAPNGPIQLSASVVDLEGRSSSTMTAELEQIESSKLSEDVQPLLTARCGFSGCHGPPFPSQGLDLSDGATHGETVNMPSTQAPLDLIEPFDPEASYLIHKVRGTQRDVGGTGGRMPSIGPRLTAEEINRIERWILLGAKDD